jgi:hypothetical protein
MASLRQVNLKIARTTRTRPLVGHTRRQGPISSVACFGASHPAASNAPADNAQVSAAMPVEWIKPDFNMGGAFCLQSEMRKFSNQLSSSAAGSMDMEEADSFRPAAYLGRKPDFSSIRPFWHELL